MFLKLSCHMIRQLYKGKIIYLYNMIKELEMLGLSPKESEIYIALVKEGETAANKLAKLTNSNRTVTYNVLQNLLRKGLISFVVRNSKRFYQISNFENLLVNIQEKELVAKEIILKLKKLKPSKTQENLVEVYEGKEGLKMVNKEILNARNIMILNATGFIKEELEYGLSLLKEFLKKNVRIIANKIFQVPKEYMNKKIKIKYLPQSEINYATTFIFNGIVIIQILKREHMLIVKIKNKALYEGYKMNFNLLWRLL